MKIEIPYPPTTNTYYRRAGRVIHISAKGRAFQKQVSQLVAEQHPGHQPITDRVGVKVMLNPPDRRRRDLDNVAGKALFDALTKAGVWADDCQIKRIVAEMGDPVPGGAATVEISALES